MGDELNHIRETPQQASPPYSDLLGSDGLIAEFLRKNGTSATWMVSKNLKMPTAKVRALLRTLEADGVVRVAPGFKYTAHNNLVWELV